MILQGDVRGLQGLARLSMYGDDTSDAGSTIGSGIGTGLTNLIRGLTSGSTGGTSITNYQPGGPTYPGLVGQPSWWDQQTLGTKFLIGGAGFLTAAGAVAWIRSRKKMTK
jgi:hypothetical protein